MLRAVRSLLGLDSAPSGPAPAREVPSAAAALLYKMATADFDLANAEELALRDGIRHLLSLEDDDPELEPLLAASRERARKAVSLYELTEVLHRELDPEQKAAVIELLWRIAYADGEVDPQEEHLVRKAAHLLHVPHERFIAAKLRVRDAR
jgi:uncharacterized tellurite resistance protein B-like protein